MERDIHLNVRTYWHDGDLPAVEWACRLIEQLSVSGEPDCFRTVIEPPSDAFIYAFLERPWFGGDRPPEVAPCGHLEDALSNPLGRFYDEATDPDAAEDDFDDPDDEGPDRRVDEFGAVRDVRVYRYGRAWLVGGAWTREDAAAIEWGATVDQPFFVIGPDDKVRPEHPWDPDGNHG